MYFLGSSDIYTLSKPVSSSQIELMSLLIFVMPGAWTIRINQMQSKDTLI